jgi:hypothetical protein
VNETDPGPVWLVALVTVANEFADVTTVHAQPLCVLTLKVALPPVPAMLKVDVDTENVQALFAGGTASVGDVGDFFEHAVTATESRMKTDKS